MTKVYVCYTEGYEQFTIRCVKDSEEKAKQWKEETENKLIELEKLKDTWAGFSMYQQKQQHDQAYDKMQAFEKKHDLNFMEFSAKYERWELT